MSRGGLGLARKGRKTRELTDRDRAPRVRPTQDRAKHTVQPTQKPTTRTSNTTSLPADKRFKRDLGAFGRPRTSEYDKSRGSEADMDHRAFRGRLAAIKKIGKGWSPVLVGE